MATKTSAPSDEMAALRRTISGIPVDLGGFNFSDKPVKKAKATANMGLAEYMDKVLGLPPAPHHQVWIEKIEACLNGTAEKPNLLVVAPPGTAKSTIFSMGLPTWYLAHHPDHNFLALTSSDPQAHKFLGTVQGVLEGSHIYEDYFPDDKIRPDKKRGWSGTGLYLQGTPKLSKDPAYLCAGWSASIIGNRAHVVLIDDPLTQAQARSRTEQAAAKSYFDDTVATRHHPGKQLHVLAVMTRWHELDLASHFIEQGDWEVVIMPALTKIGEDADGKPIWQSIWPEMYSVDFYLDKWAKSGSSTFYCVYQGDPTAVGGGIFKSAKWFQPIPEDFQPMAHPRVQYWDLTFGKGSVDSDYMVGLTLCVDGVNLVVVDVARTQNPEAFASLDDPALLGYSGRAIYIAQRIILWQPGIVKFEVDNFHITAVKDLIREVAQLCHVVPQEDRLEGDKKQRAYAPAARAEAGHLFVDVNAPWYPEFEAELLAFDNAAHDDQVDALSGATKASTRIQVVHPSARESSYRIVASQPRVSGWTLKGH